MTRLDDIAARCSRATAGPWKWQDCVAWSGIETSDGDDLLLYGACDLDYKPEWHSRLVFENEHDKSFIIEARADIPYLLTNIRAAIARIDALTGDGQTNEIPRGELLQVRDILTGENANRKDATE